MKKKCRTICIVLFAFLLLPYIVTVLINGKSIDGNGDNSPFYVKVQVGDMEKKVLWDEYLTGVVAKEIQPDYHEEKGRCFFGGIYDAGRHGKVMGKGQWQENL